MVSPAVIWIFTDSTSSREISELSSGGSLSSWDVVALGSELNGEEEDMELVPCGWGSLLVPHPETTVSSNIRHKKRIAGFISRSRLGNGFAHVVGFNQCRVSLNASWFRSVAAKNNAGQTGFGEAGDPAF